MIYVHTTQRLHFLFVYKAVVIHVLLLYNFFSFFFTFAGFAVSQGADQMVYTEMTENKSDSPKRMFPVPKLFLQGQTEGMDVTEVMANRLP